MAAIGLHTIFLSNFNGTNQVSANSIKARPNWTTLFANMSITMFVECSWTFHVVDRSGQIGQHCSPTNSIRHKLNAVYVVLATV